MAKIATLFVDKGGVLVNNDELEAAVLRAFDEVEAIVS